MRLRGECTLLLGIAGQTDADGESDLWSATGFAQIREEPGRRAERLREAPPERLFAVGADDEDGAVKVGESDG